MKRSVITLKKPSRKTVVDAAIPFLLLLLSFLFSSIWILLMGKNPLAAYMALLDGAFGSPAALMNTIKKSVPISFASFAIIVSMKGNSFNIGAEGQLALGAIGATLAVQKYYLEISDYLRPCTLLCACRQGRYSGCFISFSPR